MTPELILTATPTRHFLERANTRHLLAEVAELIMRWGIELRAAGATHLTLLRRRLPPELRDTDAAQRAQGWIIVTADDGALLTCYHRRDAYKFVKRKRAHPRAFARRRRWR